MRKRKANSRIESDDEDGDATGGRMDRSQQEEDDTENMMDATQDTEQDMANEREQMKRIKADLLKRLVHCILSSCTKRGHCRDADIAEIVTDNKEKELKDVVLKKVKKQLKEVFGMKMERDDEGKRYYLYNDLKDNIGIKIAERLEEGVFLDGAKHGEHGGGSSDEGGEEGDHQQERAIGMDWESPHFRRWLVTSTLMFIFMTKRHTETSIQTEKGVDGVLLKNFLNGMFEKFKVAPLTEKQYGELMGPAKSAEFISQGWLRCELRHDRTSGIQESYYFWGSRAEKVISKKEMLEEFCNIYGGTIKDWPNHAKMAGFRNVGGGGSRT